MSRLSIVIPVLGDQKKLDDTLVSVLENRPAHSDIFVVHNEPYDDPYDLRGEVNFVEASSGASLSECLNLGLSVSRSPIVHVLSCGVEACPGWANAALRRFHDSEVAAVASVVVRRDDRERVVLAGVGCRSEGAVWRFGQGQSLTDVAEQNNNPFGPDLMAGFYRRSALESLGGFATWRTRTFIGADLAMALHRAQLRCVVEPGSLAHINPADFSEKPGFSRGCDAEQFFWRWGGYHGWFGSLINHTAMLTGETVTSVLRPRVLAQLMGRACGLVGAMTRKDLKPQNMDQDAPLILPGPYLANNHVEDESIDHTARVA